MKISTENLAGLAAKAAVPNYDRNQVRPGILHIGVGNFHRAHQAVYANDLLNMGHDTSWGIRECPRQPPARRVIRRAGGLS